MAYGLETFSAAGVKRVSIETRLIRYVASYSGSLTTTTGGGAVYTDVTVANLVDDGTWGIECAAIDFGTNVYIGAYINNGSFRVYNRDPFAGTLSWAVTLFRS